CQPQKFRHASAFCNNVQNPTWGSSDSTYGRLVSSSYSDGRVSIRLAVTGKPLPSPVKIADTIHAPKKTSNGYLTTLSGVWTEFVQNDISRPVSYVGQCCSGTETNTATCISTHEENKCTSYSRTVAVLNRKCELGAREQMNGATAFLDASTIYGNSLDAANQLRTFEGGLMRTSFGDLLPSGDARVNESPALMVLHTLFVRQHNRLAAKLARVNAMWDDETLYQETRRLVTAQIQHVTYREFLPAVLGENLAENLKLTPRLAGHFLGYDSDAYPGSLEAAASAALSFSLAMLPAKFETFTMQAEELLYGLVSTMSRRVSLHIAKDVRRSTNGMDKVVEILMRGRDHGLPGYTAWRQFCGLSPIRNFTDLSDIVSSTNIVLLASVYSHVGDIDLFTGGLAETPLKGAVVGPTIGCILAHQFSLLRKSDRFWYENDVPPSSFSREQLQEIRKTSLAGIICQNFEMIKSMSPKVFHERDNFLNSPIPCDMMVDIELSPWVSDSPAMQVPDDLLRQSIQRALIDISLRRENEKLLFQTNKGANPKSPLGIASAFSRASPAAIFMSNTSLLLEYASEEFINHLEQPKYGRVKRQLNGLLGNLFGRLTRPLSQGLNNVDVTRFVQPAAAPNVCRNNEETLPCDNTSPFRKFGGWCNNLRNPTFGKTLTPFNRLLAAGYDDGIARPRWRSVTNQPLPSPRLISVVVHQDVSNMHRRYTMMLTYFGQFLDHDVSLTPISRGFQDAILNCRDCDSPTNVHPECWPIPIPSNDPFFPKVNLQTGRPVCMSFTRSLPGQQRLGAREQMDMNTAYLDLSHVYGQTPCESQRLRAFSGGRMNITISPFRGRDLLPQTSRLAECQAASGLCFDAGDSRATENPGLSVLHTVMVREHNRIAGQLQTLNRQWDDERLYMTSRKITGAIWQHVIYNEYLPRVLGWNAINLYGLNLLTEGFYEGYDSNCNAGIFNEFSTAAYRFGHSLVRPFFPRVDASFQEKTPILLRAGFFNSEMLMEVQAIDELVRGLFVSPMENLDQFVTGEITNHLFEAKTVPFSGFDLAALNIQRGRDHGLRPYNEYRAACNLKRATTFEDLSREMTAQVIERLKQVYASVDDIDLWTGGLTETPLQGGLVGPTFACVIGNQFRSLRRCDRFWYENGNQAGRFTEAQLAEIRKVALARLLCENSDTIGEVTRSVFDLPHNFLNPRVPCRSLPPLDLTPWREQESANCVVLGKTIALGASSLVSPCTSCTCTAEGPQCQSLRVNCQQLLTDVGRDAILADSVCRVQCAFLVNPAPAAPAPPPAPPAPQRPPQQQQGGPPPRQPQRGARLLPNLLNLFG
ncbi:hypothetical protein DAPPUDRAFT_42141, partial [Daphnia pulex]